jgi:hypothetical protein
MTHPPQPLTSPRRRILWRTMVTYYAVYKHPKVPDPITVHALNPQPLYRTFRAAGGKRRFKRVKHTATRRKVLIVAKSAKSRTRKAKNEIVDEELDELEELEELDDLDEDEDEDEPDDDDDEDEDEDEDEEDDEDDDGLEDLNVKDLRAKAREAGINVKGMKKDDLVEAIRSGVDDEDEDEEDEEDEDEEEEEEEPAPKKKGKGKTSTSSKSGSASKKKASGSSPSRSRTTDGKVGVQEVAAAAGTDARKLRMVLRKHEIEKDEDVGRYEWSSLNHPEVKKILKLVKGGAVKQATNESLAKLNAKKGKSTKSKTADAPRKKSSGTKKRAK